MEHVVLIPPLRIKLGRYFSRISSRCADRSN